MCNRIANPYTVFFLASVALIPAAAFTVCVAISLLFNYDETTRTQRCFAPQFLPSLSAAVGVPPQVHIWRWAIAVSTVLRAPVACKYHAIHSRLSRNADLVALATVCNTVELLALVLLSFVSSHTNLTVHQLAFEAFGVASVAYMFILLRLHRFNKGTSTDASSYVIKKAMCWLYNFCLLLAALFFWRHTHCEPFMYSYFALAEYVAIFANIAFHTTASIDFRAVSKLELWNLYKRALTSTFALKLVTASFRRCLCVILTSTRRRLRQQAKFSSVI